MVSQAKKDANARYDKGNTRQIKIKLNEKTDKDILNRLDAVKNKQGYIKALIRKEKKMFKGIYDYTIQYEDWIHMDRDADIDVAMTYLKECGYKPNNVSDLQLARNIAYAVKYVCSVERFPYGDQYDDDEILTRKGIDYTIPFYYELDELDDDKYNEYEDGSYIERLKQSGKYDLYIDNLKGKGLI